MHSTPKIGLSGHYWHWDMVTEFECFVFGLWYIFEHCPSSSRWAGAMVAHRIPNPAVGSSNLSLVNNNCVVFTNHGVVVCVFSFAVTQEYQFHYVSFIANGFGLGVLAGTENWFVRTLFNTDTGTWWRSLNVLCLALDTSSNTVLQVQDELAQW